MKIDHRTVASIGMVLTAGGLFLFTFLDEKTTTLFIIATLILHGFGFAFFSAPNTNAVMGSIDKRFYGVASGTLGTMRATGMMLSMGMAMLIFALNIGRAQITPAYYPLLIKSVKVDFLVFSALCLAGIFASLSRGRMR